MASERAQRLQALQSAVDDYAKKEKTRIDREVKALTDILNGRTGGKGVQQDNNGLVSKAAFNDLTAFLSS